MEVNQLLEDIQQQYQEWKFERDQEQTQTHSEHVQEFLASFMFEYASRLKGDSLQVFVDGLYGLEITFLREITLDYFKRAYERMDSLEEPRRTSNLSKIMTEMESRFNIPMLNSEKFNRANSDVMNLYWDISYAIDL